MGLEPHIIQPAQGQIIFEHVIDGNFQAAIPAGVSVPVANGIRHFHYGGLTVREEIATRILAGMLANGNGSVGMHTESQIIIALEYADALLEKTRPKPEYAESE